MNYQDENTRRVIFEIFDMLKYLVYNILKIELKEIFNFFFQKFFREIDFGHFFCPFLKNEK